MIIRYFITAIMAMFMICCTENPAAGQTQETVFPAHEPYGTTYYDGNGRKLTNLGGQQIPSDVKGIVVTQGKITINK